MTQRTNPNAPELLVDGAAVELSGPGGDSSVVTDTLREMARELRAVHALLAVLVGEDVDDDDAD